MDGGTGSGDRTANILCVAFCSVGKDLTSCWIVGGEGLARSRFDPLSANQQLPWLRKVASDIVVDRYGVLITSHSSSSIHLSGVCISLLLDFQCQHTQIRRHIEKDRLP